MASGNSDATTLQGPPTAGTGGDRPPARQDHRRGRLRRREDDDRRRHLRDRPAHDRGRHHPGERRRRRHDRRRGEAVHDRGHGLRPHRAGPGPDPLPVRHARARSASGSCGTTWSGAPSAPSSWSTPPGWPTASRPSTTSSPATSPSWWPSTASTARWPTRSRRSARPCQIDTSVPMILMDARDRESVRATLIELVRHAMARAGGLITSLRRLVPLTVVVVHRNRPERLRATVDALRGQTVPTRVAGRRRRLRARGPGRQSAAMVAERADDELLAFDENLGFGPGPTSACSRWLDARDGGVGRALPPRRPARPGLPRDGLLAAVAPRPRAGLASADVGDGLSPVVDRYFGTAVPPGGGHRGLGAGRLPARHAAAGPPGLPRGRRASSTSATSATARRPTSGLRARRRAGRSASCGALGSPTPT